MIDNDYEIEVLLDIDGLKPDDIGVEIVIAKQIDAGETIKIVGTHQLTCEKLEGSQALYKLCRTPEMTGSFDTAIRVYPTNPHLPHRMDFALVKWV